MPIDNSDALKKIDEVHEAARRLRAQKVTPPADTTDIDPAKVAQAQKRWNRRNGITS